MDTHDFDEAAAFWTKKDEASAPMPEEKLRAWIDGFLADHNTLALATASPSGVRCTPLEYRWKQHAFVIVSEGGEKFQHLKSSSSVAVAVFEPYAGFGKLASVQAEGTAMIDRLDAESYGKLSEWVDYPAAVFQKLDHPMYLIRVMPVRMDVLCSAFREQGFGTRQHLACSK